MVISKNGKRKKEDVPSSNLESKAEMPKRKKVHAQRKFAQGQGTSSSYSSNPSGQSQQGTPVIENREPPSELLPNLRPNTEDFLTFLCFRGTSVLPSHLDYFNTNKKSSTDNNKTKLENVEERKVVDECQQQPSTSSEVKNDKVNSNSTKTNKPVFQEKQEEKPVFIPFAVRKHAETVTEGKRRQTVQALKKKYQEQRMAKTHVKNFTKGTHQYRTTRSANNTTEQMCINEVKATNLETTLKFEESEKDKEIVSVSEKKKKKEPKLKLSVKTTDPKNIRKISLRNTRKKLDTTDDNPKLSIAEKPLKITRLQSSAIAKETIKYTLIKENLIEQDEQQVLEPALPITGKVNTVKNKTNLSRVENKIINQPTRVTRQQTYAFPKFVVEQNICETDVIQEDVVNKPKKKSLVEEIVDCKPDISFTKAEKSDNLVNFEKEEEFTSDDDKPLAKAIKKIENPAKLEKDTTTNKNTTKSLKSKIIEKQEVSVTCKNDELNSEKICNEKVTSRDKFASVSVADKCIISPHSSSQKKNVKNKTKTVKEPIAKSNNSEKIAEHNLKEKRENIQMDSRKRPNEAIDTEVGETTNKSIRPMRKTKTAAAIYMELIGQKLNFDEFDDDNFSMDSFPELPNVRKTQQMENELKANVGKEKPKSKISPKRSRLTKNSEDDPKTGKPHADPIKNKKIYQKDVVKKVTKKDNKIKESVTEETPAIIAPNPSLIEQSSKFEKSFSDSDDEPLATKLIKKAKVTKLKSPKKPKKIIEEIKEVETTVSSIKPRTNIQNQIETILGSPKEMKIDITTTTSTTKKDPDKLIKDNEKINVATPTVVSKYDAFVRKPNAEVAITNQKTEPINIFKTPEKSSSNLLSLPISTSPLKINKEDPKPIKLPSPIPIKSIPNPTTSESKLHTPQSGNSGNITLANLMPSKEESGKIFGIASVTLAQSSGPNDTKCTLGKCGSVHKPPLGPVVPTDMFLLSEQMSSKERRKAKVNMTHEQIQKWLTECSINTEYLEEDIMDDENDLRLSPKPINYLKTGSPMRETTEDFLTAFRAIKPKPMQPIKDRPSSVPKGPSLKAKPVLLKEDNKVEIKEDLLSYDKFMEERSTEEKLKEMLVQKEKDQMHSNAVANVCVHAESDETPKHATNKLSAAEHNKKEKLPSSTDQALKLKAEKKPNIQPKPQLFKSVNKTSINSASHASKPIATDKKPIYNQKRTPVYNTKIIDTKPKYKPVVNTFGAFSPENEPSVYSFDKEEDNILTSTPFRHHSRRESVTSRLDEQEKSTKKNEPVVKVEEKNTAKTPPQQQAVSLTLSPEDNSKSASIAVQVSMDITDLPKPKVSADGNDSDSDGHTFYIPLQGTNITGSKSDQLIQGVAVKLGTEGPEGPNQRVIMHAKLVTKSQMGSNTTPIPESMANVHEIVKSLIASKDSSSKSVPIGTVQPRFKSIVATATSSSLSQTLLQSQQSLIQPAVAASKPPSNQNKQRYKNEVTIQPSNNTAFPRLDDPAQMVEAPIFRPTEKEFQDPMEFIDRITPIAARFGLCRIIPPASFKPEYKISDDMRFTAYNLYVHKMLHRWGPSTKEFNAIKKYLTTQSIALVHPPWIGGMEVDLPRLYHTVQELGGLKEVIEKKKWARVAEEMCIPKSAQDRVTKLDDIYCRYLLPYDTLSDAERQKLFDEVEADWAKAEAKARRNADRSALNDISNNSEEDDSEDDEGDGKSMECIVKGRSMPLNAFFRIARNTMALWFKNSDPTSAEIEAEFWRHVAVRDSHVCVHSGSIDSSGWGYGFPAPGPKAKGSSCAKHPWNLKVLTNNHGSILRSIGPVTGVTVPTLHVGMLFSACCWYRDPHGLPWIEYVHTGGKKIWYGVPDGQSSNFRKAFTSLVPTHCQNKTVWLPCDTAMVPPHMLTDRGVSLCRTEQEPGQFVVVFPRAYTSNLCTGYAISESVYFATSSWLDTAKADFKDIHDSREPTMFSLEQLLFAVATDVRTNNDTLAIVLPMIIEVYEREIEEREKIKDAGVTQSVKMPIKGSKKQQTEDYECDMCRANLYISWIKTEDDNIYCLQHCLKYIHNNQIQAVKCQLMITYSIEDINQLINKIKDKQNKKVLPKKQQNLGKMSV